MNLYKDFIICIFECVFHRGAHGRGRIQYVLHCLFPVPLLVTEL